MTSMQTQSTSGREVMFLVAAHQLDAGRTCPSVPRRITYWRTCKDVDAPLLLVILMTEQIIFVSHDTEDWQRFQSFLYLFFQHRIVCHLCIHAIVGWSYTAHLGVASPLCRIARRGVRLVQHTIHEDIRCCGDGRNNFPIFHLNGAYDSRLADSERC